MHYMLYYKYKMKKEVKTMKNEHIPKKFKMTIVLNALYQINSTYIPYTFSETLEHVGKVLMPNVDITKFSKLWTWYRQTEYNIIRLHNDYRIRLSYIVAYANAHNIKLYTYEYFSF